MSPFLRQLWAVLGVLMNMMGQGMVLSFPSSILPALRRPDSPIHAELQALSWIASSIGFGGIPGFFLTSYFMERYGRRIAHALVILPGCTGWIGIYFAKDVTTLIVCRFLCGVTAGATVGLGAVVIGEYTSPENRGMFLNLKTASVSFGGMLVHILGNYFSYTTIALTALIPHFGALVIIMTWPESPPWLASRREFEKSEKSFFWLRGKNENSIKEFDDLLRARKAQSLETKNMTFSEKIKDFCNKFTRKDFLKPTFIIILGGLLLEASGRHLFPAYALDIISEITGSKEQTFFFTLALDLIITVSSTFSSVLVRIMKRRTLLFSTGFASCAVLAVICTYMFLVSRGVLSKDRSYIPIALFVAYFILSNLGCTPIPLSFLGELLPLAHRGVGSAIGGIFMSLAVNLGLQVTPFLLVNFKVQGTFAILGASTMVCLIILYFMLPETKDRTLQEIEDFFNTGSFKKQPIDDADDDAKVMMIKSDEMKIY